jgi:hypothetical protein
MGKGVQNAQMQGSQNKPSNTQDTGNFPWWELVTGDTGTDGLSRV